MSENTIHGAVPLGDDPADDPTDEELLRVAIEAASDLAATRGMHAVSVRMVDKITGVAFDADGTCTPTRCVMFTAEAIAI